MKHIKGLGLGAAILLGLFVAPIVLFVGGAFLMIGPGLIQMAMTHSATNPWWATGLLVFIGLLMIAGIIFTVRWLWGVFQNR